MEEINRKILIGERALFQKEDLLINECIFEDGESPLKESKNIILNNSSFKWKYPLWYSKNIVLNNCVLFEMARSGGPFFMPANTGGYRDRSHFST